MKHLAVAALTATLLAGSAVTALAQTATTTTNTSAPVATAAPAPAASKPTTPAKTMPMAAAKPAMHRMAQRVAHAGDPDTKALNLLEANGYTDIKSFRAVGSDYEARVDQNGKLITVTVDPGTGKVQAHAA
jgi:hypothetical protein